jgi:tetratricopeptide (TPR) repeat protein
MIHPQREDEPTSVSGARRFADRVLFIGWDGADWSILRRLLGDGRMPHLASLLEKGTSIELASPRPHETSVVWTTLATGKRPHEHGVLHAKCPAPDGAGTDDVQRSSRLTAAIWNILGRANLRSHVVGWPVTYPAESASGICVSDRFAVPRLYANHHGRGQQVAVSPPSSEPQLRARRVAPSQVEELTLSQLMPRQATGLPKREQLEGVCRTLLAESSTLFRALRWCLDDSPWDFAACVFPGIKIGHELASWLSGGSAGNAEIGRDVCERCYEHHDLLLGQILPLAGEKCHIIAVSPCGYGAPFDQRSDKKADGEGWLGSLNPHAGLAVVCGPAIRKAVLSTQRSALDLAPTLLAMLGVPIGHDMSGKPWLDLLLTDVQPDTVESWDIETNETSRDPSEKSSVADGNDQNDAVHYLLELGYADPDDVAARESANECRQETELNRAVSLLEAALVPQAVAQLNQIAEQNPDWLLPHELLAKAYYQSSERKLAKHEIDWLSWHGDETPPLYLLMAAIALEERHFDLALEYLRCAKRARLPLPGLLALKGSVHLRKRQFMAAAEAFQSSIDSDGPTAQALDGLATTSLHAGRHEEAALHALAALERDMRFGRAHFHLGLALLQLKRVPEALRAFETWAAIDTERAAPFFWLAHVARHHLHDLSLASSFRHQSRERVRLRRESPKQTRSDDA